MWPGRPKVCGVDSGSARARIVAARSAADTPVEHPSSLSTVTVNGVPSIDVLSCTWCGKSSSSQRLSVTGAQSTPRAFLSMKFTFSGVIFSAAMMRSPSFSRSSSSTTITNLPSLKSSSAASMLLSLKSSISIFSLFMILISVHIRIHVLTRSSSPPPARPSRWQIVWPAGRGAV